MLAECVIAPWVFSGAKERRTPFIQPFSDQLTQSAQREHAVDYLSGLVSDLKHKCVESITCRHDLDRRNPQHFILSDAPQEIPRKEFVRLALPEHCIEEAIKRARVEAGLADYEVGNWRGWHHRQALSMISAWLRVSETLREKTSPGDYRAADPRRYRHALSQHLRMPNTCTNRPAQYPTTHPK